MLAICLLIHSLTAHSQNRFSIAPTVGLVTPILDNGLGFQVGVNPSFIINDFVAAESQFSYTFVDASAFLTGEETAIHSFYALIGGRLYFAPRNKKVRPYLNAMIGGFRSNNSDGNLGFSTGGFMELNRTVVGICLESQQNIVLKLGRRF